MCKSAIAVTDVTCLRLLLLSDSALPTGSFCHSYGLETCLSQQRLSCDVGRVQALLAAIVREGLARGEGPAFVLAYRATARSQLQELVELDQEALAMHLPAEWRRASVATGRRLLAIGAQLWPSPILEAYRHAVDRGDATGARPIVAAMIHQAAGIPLEPALLSYLYSAVQGLVSAVVRLAPLGQTQGVKLLSALLESELGEAAKCALATPRWQVGSFLPELEIMGMQHERLPTRLFVS